MSHEFLPPPPRAADAARWKSSRSLAESLRARLELADAAGEGRLPWSRGAREIREALGFTREQVAEAFGMTAQQVSELEAGTADPPVSVLQRLAAPFGLAVGLVPAEAQPGELRVSRMALDYLGEEGNEVGGSLHIVLDDGNVRDEDLEFCVGYASERGDRAGVALAMAMLRLPEPRRRALYLNKWKPA